MRARDIEAYRRRLAKRTSAGDLTTECIGAVMKFYDVAGDEHVGTLTSFKVHPTMGLFGPTLAVTVTLCEHCVGRQGGNACVDTEPIDLWQATPIRLVRNEDGAREAVNAA